MKAMKKWRSLLLCSVLVLGLLPMTALAAEGSACTAERCSGTYTNGFCSADSIHYEAAAQNASGYYEIGNAGQIYWFAALVNGGTTTANGILTADITVNKNVLSASGEPNSDTFTDWTPIGNNSTKYSGTFDGANHAISGLYLDGYGTSTSTGTKYVGLFGYVNNGTVKNVTLKDSFFGAYEKVGGIAGCFWGNKGKMENCFSYATVKGLQDVGGIAGMTAYATATDCINYGLVLGSNMTGGFAGEAYFGGALTRCGNEGTVKWIAGSRGALAGFTAYTYSKKPFIDCYNAGDVIYGSTGNFKDSVGGFVANERGSTYTNCYSSGTITVADPDHYVGGFAGNAGSNSATAFTNCYYNSDAVAAAYAYGSPNTSPTGMAASAFTSGEVTYKLNGSTSEGDLAWGQTIGTDANPNFTGLTVYYDETANPQYFNDIPAVNFTVSFDANGGSGEMADVTEVSGDYTLPECTFTAPNGKVFAGWATSADGEVITVEANTTLYAVWKDKKPFDISFARMTLANALDMGFAFEVDLVEDWTGAYVDIVKSYANGTTQTQTVNFNDWGQTTIEDVRHYFVTFKGIAAKEMTDEVQVTVYNADGEAISSVWTDTVRGYAMRTLADVDTSVKGQTMIVDMLNYGTAAQTYFGYNKDDLATSELTEEQKALATETISYENTRETGENYKASRLELVSSINLMMAFQNVDQTMKAVITYTDHYGDPQEVTVEGTKFVENNGAYVVYIDTIAVADARQDVTVTIYDGDTVVAYATDSVESYVARMSDADDLFELIMKFSDSSYAYLHE